MGAEKEGGDESVQVTEETPAFGKQLKTNPPIDPWVELTDAGHDDDDPDVIDALGWEEHEFPPDGPVAAPLDEPDQAVDAALIPTADLEPPPPPRVRAPSMRSKLIDEMEPTHYQQEVRQLLNQPMVVPRKTPARSSSGAKRRELTPPPRSKSKARSKTPDRRYPKMLSLLSDAESVPLGSEPGAEPPPPPVPGTFFPSPRAPLFERPAPADLDDLLATMAEGLLIGEAPDGGTEVRVTLRDEFFAGTELRIRVGNGEISAQLIPPDRDIYWQLNGNLDELRERLASRGLTVRELVVLEP
jgi:hypothetical protein